MKIGFFHDSWRGSSWQHGRTRTKASAGKIVAGALALKQWTNLISIIPKRKPSAVWQGSRFPDYKKTTRMY